MRIERFDGVTDCEQLHSCFDIAEESWQVDTPHLPAWSFGSFSGKWGQGYDSHPRQCWLASDDAGAPVGCYLLTLPQPDNPTLARAILTVRPSRRRAGTGRLLLAHCARQARAAGRTRLTGYAWDGSPGAAFATSAGARGGISELTRTLELGRNLPAKLTSLRQTALPYAAGYSLLTWQGVTPDEYLADVARVHAAMADAPRDEGVEPSVWDVDRIRRADATARDHGVVFYSAAARDSRSGEFAALTQICTDPGAPGWGIQQTTAVRPEHRGHRLGLLVKIALLESLASEAPDIRRFVTGNAGSNAHMISINEQLGFAVVGVYRSWELDVTTGSFAQS
jgi:GNAT superfamily N-acetyltransferase